MPYQYEAIVEQGKALDGLQRLYRAIKYGHNYVLVKRDNDSVAANFKDVVGMTSVSPAFTNLESIPPGFADGTAGPTEDATMDRFLQSIASGCDWFTYHPDDLQTEEGRNIPYVYMSGSGQLAAGSADNSSRLRVWLQGGVHGNEPAGDQSLLALIGKMVLNQRWTESILSRMDILVVPRYNPDGVAYFQRTLASNLDPNRDHVKLARQQTRDIKQLFNSFAPCIVVDMHEFTSSKRYGGKYVHASDALFSAAKNLNIDEGIRRMSENLFATNIAATLEAADLRWGPYVTGSSTSIPGASILFKEAGSEGKIGRNAMGLTQSISFVCETRGITLADQHFQRRTVAALVMVESIIQTAADHADEVCRVITNGVRSFIDSSEDIVVTDFSTNSNRTFQMVNLADGSVENVPVQFASTTPTVRNLTRAQPETYIIPRAWPDLAARLAALGLEVKQMQCAFRGTVEALKITSLSFENTYDEGIVPVQVTTSAVKKEVELPAGSFTVSTRQRNAALALIALEPENIDSYVASNVIHVEEGGEYSIYRVMALSDPGITP